MKKRFVTIPAIFILVIILFLNTNVIALAESQHSYYFSKGKSTYSSHFSGIPIWTIIQDQNLKIIYQTEDNRVVVKADLIQSNNCEKDSNLICFDGTVTYVTNSDTGPIKVGDMFKVTFDLGEKTETVSFLSGFLENVDVKIGQQKTRTNFSNL